MTDNRDQFHEDVVRAVLAWLYSGKPGESLTIKNAPTDQLVTLGKMPVFTEPGTLKPTPRIAEGGLTFQ